MNIQDLGKLYIKTSFFCEKDIICRIHFIPLVSYPLETSDKQSFSVFYFLVYAPLQQVLFFNCYLAAPWLTLGHSQRDSLTNSIVMIEFLTISTRRSPGTS